MAYDEELAHRIRELLGAERGVEEKPMFGGLAFLINGNMAVAASGQGGLMVRVPPDDTAKLLSRDHVAPMTMAGRETRGWLRVSIDGVKTKRQLQPWVTRGADYAGVCPRKTAGTPADVDAAARKKRAAPLLEHVGTTYAEDAGIRLADKPMPLFELLTSWLGLPTDSDELGASARGETANLVAALVRVSLDDELRDAVSTRE